MAPCNVCHSKYGGATPVFAVSGTAYRGVADAANRLSAGQPVHVTLDGVLQRDAGTAAGLLTPAEWRVAGELKELLGHFAAAGCSLEGDAAVLGDVLPAFSRLGTAVKEFADSASDGPVKRAVVAFLATTWEERLRRVITPLHQLAAALEPNITPALRRRLFDEGAVKAAVEVLKHIGAEEGGEEEGEEAAFRRGFGPVGDAETRLRHQIASWIASARWRSARPRPRCARRRSSGRPGAGGRAASCA